jgi:hypothetical protein
MSPNAAFTVYYSAVLLRNGGIKTAIEAERTAHDALLSVREDLAPGSWEAIGIYTAIPTIAAFDGDGHIGPGGLVGLRLRVDLEAVGVLGRNARSNWHRFDGDLKLRSRRYRCVTLGCEPWRFLGRLVEPSWVRPK